MSTKAIVDMINALTYNGTGQIMVWQSGIMYQLLKAIGYLGVFELPQMFQNRTRKVCLKKACLHPFLTLSSLSVASLHPLCWHSSLLLSMPHLANQQQTNKQIRGVNNKVNWSDFRQMYHNLWRRVSHAFFCICLDFSQSGYFSYFGSGYILNLNAR